MLTFLYSAALALSTTAGTSLLPASAVARLQPVLLQAAGAGGLTLQRAPPGGGIGGGDGGDDGNNGRGRGGGGGGDDDADASEFLRLLNSAEQASVCDDWVSRSRIYKMTDDPELRAAHSEHLIGLEAVKEFDTTESGPRGRRMLLGLFQDDEVRAMAGAEVSHASGLVVSSLHVYPAELNNQDSTASLRMVHALHLLADAIETPLDLTHLREEAPRWLEQLVFSDVEDLE